MLKIQGRFVLGPGITSLITDRWFRAKVFQRLLENTLEMGGSKILTVYQPDRGQLAKFNVLHIGGMITGFCRPAEQDVVTAQDD